MPFTMQPVEHAFLASLFALALGAAKLAEAGIKWATKRYLGKSELLGHSSVVSLDPDTSRMLRETHEMVSSSTQVLARADNSGIPLVYSAAPMRAAQERMVDVMDQISVCQARMSDTLERIERRTEKTYEQLAVVLDEIKDRK